MGAFLIILGNLFLITVLMYIADISSMFNDGSAHKGKPESITKGSASILAVARSYVHEIPPRNRQEDQEYMIFLEYVQAHEVSVHLGIPGYMMFGITKRTVSQFFFDATVKFPLLVSLFLAIREQVVRMH